MKKSNWYTEWRNCIRKEKMEVVGIIIGFCVSITLLFIG